MSKRRTNRPAPGSGAERAARDERRARDAQLTEASRNGDTDSFRRLVDGWVDPAFDRITRRGISGDMAGSVLTRTFRVARRDIDEGSSGTFGAFVARAAADQAGGPRQPTPELTAAENRHAFERLTRGTDPEALAEDEAVAGVLWEASSVFGEQGSDVLDLHWRYGLDTDEIETTLGLASGEADDMITKMPRGFAAAVRTRLLWGDGSPEHDVLVAELRKQGATSFDAQTVRIINRHIRECAVCRARSLVALPAIDVFAAIPMESAPTTLRKEVVVATTVATAGAAGAAAAATLAPPMAPEHDTDDDLVDHPAVLAGSAAALGAVGGAALAGNDTTALDPGEPAEVPAADPPAYEPPAADNGRSPLTGVTIPATAAALTGTVADVPSGPAHEPVTSKRTDEPDGSSKRWMVIGIAAALVLIAGIAFAATRGGGGDAEVDTASASSTVPSSTTTSSSVSTTTAPTTTPSTETTETVPTTVATTPVTTPGFVPPPTTAAPTTTAPLNLQVEFAIKPNIKDLPYNQTNAPRISWNVTSGRNVTVTVSGPGLNTTVSTTGDSALCPAGWMTGDCSAAPGVYNYRLVVEENGQIWRDEVRQLTIR